jgi:type IV secretory pathway VirB2 component (pilin)
VKNLPLPQSPTRARIRGARRELPPRTERLIGRGIAHLERRQTTYGVIVVITVSLLASLLTAQGWRSHILTFDLVTVLREAHALVSTGALPKHSDLGTYGSFNTPGPAWLMVPSILLFHDPRVSEYVGAGLLHLVTLLGVFLLGRKYFGTWCGCLAVVLYGLSAQGLWWAGSLWTFGSPDMFIWIVYLASEWVTRRDGRFLAAAIGAYALGMYVDLALAPAIAVLPAIWLVYRPPVTLKPLLAAAAVLLVVWSPYLRFEAGRSFADLRSQLTLKSIVPSNVSRSWCDPRRKLKAWPTNAHARAASAYAESQGPAQRLVSAANRPSESSAVRLGKGLENNFRDRLLGNFLVTRLSARDAIGSVLLLSVLASLVLFTVTGSARRAGRSDQHDQVIQDGHRTRRGPITRVAAVAAVLALGTWFVVRQLAFSGELPRLVRAAVAILLLGGAALVFSQFREITDRLLRRGGVHIQSEEQVRRRRLLVVALAAPWLVLFAAAEPGVPERFLWLLPLQVLVLAAFVTVLLPRLGVPRPAVWLAQVLLVFVFLWNPLLISRVDSWRADGWSGHDATEARVANYIAADIHKEGRDRASIGYQIFIYPFMVDYHSLSPNYKVGSEFDVVFRYQHGIENTDRCAEGVSPGDDYRIVQTHPLKEPGAPTNYFEVPHENRFKLVREIGQYRIFKATQVGT